MSEYTSKELSHSLQESGFKSEHEQCWFKGEKGIRSYLGTATVWEKSNREHCPAYTFTELWRKLPVSIDVKGSTFYKALIGGIDDTEDVLAYEHHRGTLNARHVIYESISSESPAEAAGLMIKLLITDGRIKANHE